MIKKVVVHDVKYSLSICGNISASKSDCEVNYLLYNIVNSTVTLTVIT